MIQGHGSTRTRFFIHKMSDYVEKALYHMRGFLRALQYGKCRNHYKKKIIYDGKETCDECGDSRPITPRRT